MSESTPTPTPASPVSTVAELASAFEKKESAPQEQAQAGQENQKEDPKPSTTKAEDTKPSDDTSRPDAGTVASRTAPAPTREEILSGLTLEELRAHPALGPAIKSYADQEAAAQLRGKTNQLRQELTQEITIETARKHFDSLSKEDLAEELASVEGAPELYARVKATPPPPPPGQPVVTNTQGDSVDAAVSFFAQGIRTYQAKIAASGLSPEEQAKLDPTTHLAPVAGKSGEEIFAAWQLLVDDTIMNNRIGKATKPIVESQELEAQARADENRPGGALMENGTTTSPLPDLINTRSEVLLADAFARRERASAGRK